MTEEAGQKSVQIIGVDPNGERLYEKNVRELTPGKHAQMFCQMMGIVANGPLSYKKEVIRQIRDWKLLDDDVEPEFDNKAEYYSLIRMAGQRALEENPDFLKAFGDKPWRNSFSVEGVYDETELEEMYPLVLKLRELLGEKVGAVFCMMPDNKLIRPIVREDGKKQVVDVIERDGREFDDIKRDVDNAPDIIPPREVYRLSRNYVVVLTDWVDGHDPATQEEKEICLREAEKLLIIPRYKYDLAAPNFKIGDDGKVYWVDADMIEEIVKSGYVEPDEKRKQLFEDGKQLMK